MGEGILRDYKKLCLVIKYLWLLNINGLLNGVYNSFRCMCAHFCGGEGLGTACGGSWSESSYIITVLPCCGPCEMCCVYPNTSLPWQPSTALP